MSRFVTQAVIEQPRVALVGVESSLTTAIQVFLTRHEFEVIFFDLAELGHTKKVSDYLENKASGQWYKTIIVDVWSDKNIDLSIFKSIFNYFSDHTNQLYLIQQYQQSLEDQAEYDRRVLRHWVESTFPQANVVCGQNIVVANQVWWPFKYIISRLSELMLLDPGGNFFLISQKTFHRLIQSILVRPEQSIRLLVRGQTQPAEAIVKEIKRQYELYHQTKLIIQSKPLEYESEPLDQFYQVVEAPAEQLPALLQETLQALPSPQGLARQQEPSFHQQTLAKPQVPVKPVVVDPVSSIKPLPDKPILNKILINQPKITKNDSETKPTQPNESLDSKISSLFSHYRTENKVTRIAEKAVTTKKLKVKNKKRGALFVGGVGIAGAALGILVLAVIFLISGSMLRRSLLSQITSPDQANASINRLTQFVELQTESYELFLPAPFFDSAHEVLALASEWRGAQAHIQELGQNQIGIVQKLLGNEDYSDFVPVPATQVAYEDVSRLSSRFEDLSEEDLPPDQHKAVTEYLEYLRQQRTNFVTYQQLAPLFSTLLAENDKRTYAIVLQNNHELRATGGFIQAIALVTLEKGRLIDTQVFSSYQLDESFSGQVSPPPDLEKVLGEQQLFLRDSNWSPDFPTSAKQINFFLEKQLNKKIDGTIALNLLVLEDILRAVGPLELDQFNELLTDRNLQERMEFHSEVTLVESDQSSDYSVIVLEKLLEKVKQTRPEKTSDLLAALHQNVQDKNLLISLSEPNELANLSQLGWSGEIVVPNCPAQFAGENCVVDSLAVIDSNVGVNKANFHTSRSDAHHVELQPVEAKHTHTVTFENNSQSNSWPKGAYKSYLRFILPSSARLSEITVNGTRLGSADVIESKIGQLSAVGVLSSTPIQEKTTIVVEYSTPLTLEDKASYTLFLQKQAGIEQPLKNVTVSLAPGFKPSLIAPQATVAGNDILFEKISSGHLFLGVSVNQ